MSESNVEEQLLAGKGYLLRIENRGRFDTVDVPQDGELRGELRLYMTSTEPGTIRVRAPSLGLVGTGVEAGGDYTGHLSVRGLGGRGHISEKAGEWRLELDVTAEVVYEAIGRELGYERIAEDVFVTPVETFAGHVSGTIVPVSETPEGLELAVSEGMIHLVYREKGLGLIRSILLPLEGVRLEALAGVGGPGPALNNPCHPDLQTNRRTLRVQPVGFRSSASDTSPSGDSTTRQFNAANAIWGKCCVQFDVQPIHIITSSTLKTTSDAAAVRDSYTDSDASTIEVFFVDNALASMGGGVCYSVGSSLSKVVISDNNVGNDNLLAHELGHTLSGLHPGTTWTGLWTGDTNTVLVPSGSATIANPDENTHWNCINATNPAMTTTTTACCLTHDITNHHIRDFPEDSGVEPASAPPGRNFYSMSNLWNRLSNSAGGVTADGRPEHQQPVRFNPDGSAFQNYMFAKVEATVNLPPRNMQVRFYLKHPGSGGGASHVNHLGSAPVSDSLRPGIPQTVSLPWTVPSGTPQHSCMFAVIRSPSEPHQDINALNWTAVEAMVRADNDWVQRNLNVEDYPSAPNNEGMPNKVWNAPIIIAFPDEESSPLPVILEIDARRAKRLLALAIEVPGRERHEIDPGSMVRLELDTRLGPGEELPLVLFAVIPGDADVGEVYHIGVDPWVGKDDLLGYGFDIRINKPYRFLAQLLDLALAALVDYAELTGSEVADRMAWFHREILAAQWLSPARFQKQLPDREEWFRILLDELVQFEIAHKLGVIEAFERFLEALPALQGIQALSFYRDAMARLQLMVLLMRR